MNSTHGNFSRIIATGFVVSMVFSIALFWTDAELRKIGKEDLVNGAGLRLSLTLDLGGAEPLDPNLEPRPPRAICEFRDDRYCERDIFLDVLLEVPHWIVGYEFESFPGRFGRKLDTLEAQVEWHPQQGLITAKQVSSEAEEAPPRTWYVGPKGFGDTPDRTLGRFSSPQLCYHDNASTLFVYDADLQALYRIDFDMQKVTSKSWADKPVVATGRRYLSKFQNLLQIHAHEASRLETDPEVKARLGERPTLLPAQDDEPLAAGGAPRMELYRMQMMDDHGADLYRMQMMDDHGADLYGMQMMDDPRMELDREDVPIREAPKRILVGPSVEGALSTSGPWAMDDEGTIYLIDRNTLSLSPPKGQLPDCGQEKTHNPSQLLAYCVLPLFVDEEYFGLLAASLSRDSSEAVMVLLDQQGREIDRSTSHLKPRSYRYGLVTSYARTVLDFAQPLAFSAASSLWGPRTEAIAGYRSLFVLPLSLPARIAGDRTMKTWDRYGTLIMWNVFTWCVGLLLAIAVIRDLKRLGMSNRAQKAWLFACMGFGWIAAIAYLMTRPRAHFVTCTGCGRTRRTDHAVCLHCEADWDMCALQVPGWRVKD